LPYLVVAVDGGDHVVGPPRGPGLLATHRPDGPRNRGVVLATTAVTEPLPEPVLDAFPARIALRLPDAEQSVRILGDPGAEELAGDGEFLLGRRDTPPRRFRSLRIEPEDMAECVALMAAALGAGIAAPTGTAAPPAGENAVPAPSARPADSPLAHREEMSPVAGGAPAVSAEVDARSAGSAGSVVAPPDDPIPAPAIARAGAPADPLTRGLLAEDEARLRGLVRVYCLGRFRVFAGMTEITGHNGRLAKATRERALFTAKPRELLAYFATFPNCDVARERVLEILWPDADPDAGNRALYNALWVLRNCVNGPGDEAKRRDYVSPQSGGYRIERELFWVDAWEFDACARQAEAGEAADPEQAVRWRERAVELYQGDYLDQCYYEWAETERTRMRQTFLQTVKALVDHHAKNGRLERAIALLVKAIERESFDESLHRKLLQLYARASDWRAVVQHYENLEALLARELELKPERKTQELYQRLLARRDGEPRPVETAS
jgi:DNA-binding SARP family transcriptional activator